ncbi:hypothetical protein [uncultured Bartonella sp.]|uniref:hypothetical protein n=1 Tax=uncultured Bartonella sp. TaxID=104108 RepID=UPI002625C509|nr:hypothetical protein [uncultured Bartonella sp.]
MNIVKSLWKEFISEDMDDREKNPDNSNNASRTARPRRTRSDDENTFASLAQLPTGRTRRSQTGDRYNKGR